MSGLLNPYILAPVGGGGGDEAETTALVARMTTPPTTLRRSQINTLIAALKSNGVWSKLDVLVILAAADAQAALLNWKADANNPTAVSAPSFTADRGYTGNNTSAYLNSNFNPAVHGVGYTLNSAHVSAWSRTAAADPNGGTLVGGRDNGSDHNTYLHGNTQGSYIYNVNHGSGVVGAATDGSGHLIANRTASAASQGYRNGSLVGTSSVVANASPSVNLYVLAWNSIGVASEFANAQVAAYSAGAGLTATEATNFYSAMNAYMVAVGAA